MSGCEQTWHLQDLISYECSDRWDQEAVSSIIRDRWDARTVPDVCVIEEAESVQVRFNRLAAEWSESTGHISSTSDVISHKKYQEIIDLGWDVVPWLLKDLRDNKRFWFPALYEITKVKPFDSSDVGNGPRMIEAWLRWGKLNRYI